MIRRAVSQHDFVTPAADYLRPLVHMSMFNIDWADAGPISQGEDDSLLKGITGFASLPGSSDYWGYERANGAPFLAFGGWMLAVSGDSDVQVVAIELALHMTNQDAYAEFTRMLVRITGATGRPEISG